jgi:hypothetical protein
MSIACHVKLPPFLFRLFSASTWFAAALFARFELKIWSFLGSFESFNGRMFIHLASEIQAQVTAAKAGLARATLFFWFRHVKMLLL